MALSLRIDCARSFMATQRFIHETVIHDRNTSCKYKNDVLLGIIFATHMDCRIQKSISESVIIANNKLVKNILMLKPILLYVKEKEKAKLSL
jgi:hypothetical protein